MNPTLLADLILAAVILLFAFFGWRKGALATLISLVGGIAAVTLAVSLASPISATLADSVVAPALRDPISAVVENAVEESGSLTALLQTPPDSIRPLFELIGVDTAAFPSAETTEALTETLVGPAANMLSFAVAFLVLFLLFLVAVRILLTLAKKFNKIPVLGKANRALGLVIGLLQGLLFAWVCACIFHFFLPTLMTGQAALFASFDENATVLYKALHSTNPISLISESLLAARQA